MSKLIDDNITMKQELFILRQTKTSPKPNEEKSKEPDSSFTKPRKDKSKVPDSTKDPKPQSKATNNPAKAILKMIQGK